MDTATIMMPFRFPFPAYGRTAGVSLLALLLGMILAAPAVQAQSSVLHVKPGAGGDCSSWSNACGLQDALGQATGSHEIWVAEGSYTPGFDDSFEIDGGTQDGLKLYGGFAPDEGADTFSERDPQIYDTELNDSDGNGSSHILMIDGSYDPITSATVIDGVTVQFGSSGDLDDLAEPGDGGAGLYCEAFKGKCNPMLSNMVFLKNTGRGTGANGAAIYNDGNGGVASPTITNAVFKGNRTYGEGGAIFNDGENGEASPTIINAIFVDNEAVNGGGGAIYNTGKSNPTLTNVVFLNNNSSGASEALYNTGNSTPTVTNSVFAAGERIYNQGSGVTLSVSYSLLESGPISISDNGGSTTDYDAGTNLEADPQFTAPDDVRGEDFDFATLDDGLRLAPGSPALNAGDAGALPPDVTTDLVGDARFKDGAVDMGAYEGAFAPRLTGFAPAAAAPGAEVTITGEFFTDVSGVSVSGVTIGGAAASVTSTSPTQITVTVPEGASDGPVEVTTSKSTATSSADFDVTAPPYGSGQALAFDGSGDYVSAPGEAASPEAGTFAHWVYIDPNASGSMMLLYASDGTSSQHNGFTGVSGIEFHTAVNGDAKLAFSYDDGGASASVTGTTTLESGRWYHLAATYDATGGGDVKLYVNGRLDGTGTISGTPGGSDPTLVRLGRPGSDGRYLSGKIDEARTWSSVRTQEEIRQSMHETLSGGEAGLAAYWRFDDGDAATAYDYAGANDGALEGDAHREASGAALGQSSTLANTAGETTVGETSAQLTATITSTPSGSNYLTLYAYGRADGPAVTGETFPEGITKRANRIWGVAETGSVTTDLTFSYGQIQHLNLANVRLLKREGPGDPWQNVTGQFTWDEQTKTFTATGVTAFSQFAVAEASQPLPVELAGGLKATPSGGTSTGVPQVRLTWETTSEENNDRFEVKRRAAADSTRPEAWTRVARLESKAPGGTSSEALRYAATDAALPFEATALEYRLVQIDRDGTEMIAAEKTVEVGAPQAFTLHGNFPNPMRSSTTIRYELPEERRVTVAVYDALGRRVRTLVDEEQRGRQEVAFEARGLASGVYFYRITAGSGYTQTRKLVLVR